MILTLWATPSTAETVNKVLAHVGSKIITEYDVQGFNPRIYKEILSIKDDSYRELQLKEYTEAALDFIIGQELMVVAAARENITVKEQEVDMAISDILARNSLTMEQLEQELEKEGSTMSQYRYKLKNDILKARVQGQILMPKIIVSERDLREAAEKKPEEYPLYDKYNISIIITQDKNSIKKAVKEIKSTSFDEAVKKYSIDPSAVNGGQMGWMESEIMSPAMLAAVEATEIGSVSEPFEINNQWAVCKVNEFKSKYDFDEETREKLTEEAAQNITTKVFTEWFEGNKRTIVVIKRGDK